MDYHRSVPSIVGASQVAGEFGCVSLLLFLAQYKNSVCLCKTISHIWLIHYKTRDRKRFVAHQVVSLGSDVPLHDDCRTRRQRLSLIEGSEKWRGDNIAGAVFYKWQMHSQNIIIFVLQCNQSNRCRISLCVTHSMKRRTISIRIVHSMRSTVPKYSHLSR